MKVRITQIDGALPNLALMRLSHWHKAQGDDVVITRKVEAADGEGAYDRVYGSAIFDFSKPLLERFRAAWPGAIVGGTGSGNAVTVEEIVDSDYPHCDYSGWPDFDASIGFTQRGCRFECGFCVVPKKEGKPRPASTIAELWRGPGHPKKLHLLDNDFFGPAGWWQERIAEIREGGFRVCLSQGVNVRVISEKAAEALASIEYRDTKFERRRLYTAWDNIGDERIFFRGVDRLEGAGVPPRHLMAYMLVGFDPLENWARIWHRFDSMVARGIRPFPMVYRRDRADLRAFARWVNTGLYRAVSFSDYKMTAAALEELQRRDPAWGLV